MTVSFADDAHHAAALAARLLGWRPAEFWSATPAELATALTDPFANRAHMDRTQLEHMLEAERHG